MTASAVCLVVSTGSDQTGWYDLGAARPGAPGGAETVLDGKQPEDTPLGRSQHDPGSVPHPDTSVEHMRLSCSLICPQSTTPPPRR